jgi:hypothetical protein
MEPHTKSDYASPGVDVAFAVLLEFFAMLGEFREHIAVIGGWVPRLLLPEAGEEHVGSLDVDVAIDFARISDRTYATLLQTLVSHGYRQDPEQPFRLFRSVRLGETAPVEVEVDLLAGEYGGTGRTHRTQRAQDARARKARGADLVFDHYKLMRLEGRLPNGALDVVTVKVADIAAFLVMKGMALHGRRAGKDCYDVYYCARHCPGGTTALIRAFRPLARSSLATEGLSKIRSAFISPEHFGPVGAADFMEVRESEEREIVMRDAYERLTALLDTLQIPPWEDS